MKCTNASSQLNRNFHSSCGCRILYRILLGSKPRRSQLEFSSPWKP